jgi:magnesium transporter
LIGRLTVDEMVDVMREESDSEVLNLAGLKEEEDLFAPVIDSVKTAGPGWPSICALPLSLRG